MSVGVAFFANLVAFAGAFEGIAQSVRQAATGASLQKKKSNRRYVGGRS
jgi:hypothetical protein